MKNQDKAKFAEILTGTAVCYNREISQQVAKMFMSTLAEYSIADIENAFQQHIRQSKFFPTIAEIIKRIPNNGEHLSADEAWTIAVDSFDELSTVILTDEILQAKSTAQDLWDYGDKIAARVAFKSAYERIVSQSSSKVIWRVSLGSDKSRRVSAIDEALRIGRVNQATAQKYLPDMRDAGAISGLLTGKVVECPKNNEVLKKRWGMIKTAIDDGAKKMAEIERQEKLREKKETVEFKSKREEAISDLQKLNYQK